MRSRRPAADVFTATYDLLGRAYLGGPRAVTPDRLPALDALFAALSEVDPRWRSSVESLLAGHAADLRRAHSDFVECLATPVTGRYVPPYASVYLDGGQLWGPSTFQVLSCYEAEGLAWDRARPGPGGCPVRAPDHVGVEMAFLSVASGRPAASRCDTATARRLGTVLAHAAAWLPLFRDALRASSTGAGLAGWTAFAAEVVDADLHRRSAGAAGAAVPLV